MQFHSIELDNGIRLIQLGGELDLTGTTDVDSELASHVIGENVKVILDLSRVTFLASIGVRLIVMTAKSLASRGGRLAILNPIPAVRDVLDVTGLPQVIPVFGSLEEATKELAT
jgi:anti-sigma B factor antagonist